MEVETIAQPDEFLTASSDLLLEDEARHNLILGIAGTLRDHPAVYEKWRLWLVREGDTSVAAALQTPPFNLVLARPRTPDALAPLVDALVRGRVDLPGVTAAVPEADTFADLWERRTNARRRLRMKQRVYAADATRPPVDVSGRLRTVTPADRGLLVSWLPAFTAEALGDVGSPTQDTERWVDARLGGAGGFALWEDSEPVSLAGWGGRTPNGVRIGPVYTPPEHRRRGYGSAVTAAVSAEQLAVGRRFCFLYTDLANPTSNRIYVDIGYEPVCDSVDYAFVSPGAAPGRP